MTFCVISGCLGETIGRGWKMMTERIREFKKMLKDGCVVGPFSKTLDPAFIEIMGHAGCDFVILDLEHGLPTG